MAMIKTFSCANFRNVKVNDLKFGRINLLIGPNNSGKTNLIRALSFVANMVSNVNKNSSTGFLSEVQRNGTSTMLCRKEHDPSVSLRWRIALKNQQVDYSLAFRPGKEESDCYILNESLDSALITPGNERPFNFFSFHDERPGQGMISTAQQMGEPNSRVLVHAERNESALLQFENLIISNQGLIEQSYVRTTLFSMLKEMQQYFSQFYSYMSSQFDFEQVRQLKAPDDFSGKSLLKDGSNFINVYLRASKNDPDFEDRFLFKMRSMISGLHHIEIVEGLDKIGMKLFMDGTSYYLSEVSDGTIEALLLALLTSLPEDQAPSLLAIDEPEVNLHPAWQSSLAKWIQTSGNFKQCFISTHSSDFLDSFTEGFKNKLVDIFVWDRMGGNAFKPLDYNLVMEELEKGWMLGDLYRVNDPSIGGWPR